MYAKCERINELLNKLFKCLDVRDNVKDNENTCCSNSVTPRWMIPPLHKVESPKERRKMIEQENKSKEEETKTV